MIRLNLRLPELFESSGQIVPIRGIARSRVGTPPQRIELALQQLNLLLRADDLERIIVHRRVVHPQRALDLKFEVLRKIGAQDFRFPVYGEGMWPQSRK